MVFAVGTAQYAVAQELLDQRIDQNIQGWIRTYKHLHENPELSTQEKETSALLASDLRRSGYQVTDHFGQYENPRDAAYGIVAVLKNGPGPTVYVRTEMDALPIIENTGLPYASKVKVKRGNGEVGVMHACGHDLHMTVFLGTAREMASRKSEWHGTLMLIAQPSEEMILGAGAMLADHLYERFGRPDFVIAEHDSPDVPAGSIAVKGGPLLASATSIDVTMRGIGGHGSRPEAGKDPIVLAAEFVLVAQTIVSRQIDPQQPAVLTVGTIHGGTKNNIIPDEVTMGLTLRTYSAAERDQIVAAIRRTANGLAEAYGIPAERMPTVTVVESTPATINDAALTERVRAAAAAVNVLGKERVLEAHAVMGSEDVGLFSLDGKIPAVMYWLGAADEDKLAESRKTGVPLPGLHSALFAPVYAPAIATGVTAMSGVALELLK